MKILKVIGGHPLSETLGKYKKLFCIEACVCYFLSIAYFLPNDSPSKTMRNAFYFI